MITTWALWSTSVVIALASCLYISYRLRVRASSIRRDAEVENPAQSTTDASLSAPARRLRDRLETALPDITVLPKHGSRYEGLMNAYWAQQACEVPPACIVRPRDVHELSQAVNIIKNQFDKSNKETIASPPCSEGLFAIRSGGHSPVAGASNMTRFTVRSFPSAELWSGFLYLHSSQAPKVVAAFHDFVNRVVTSEEGKTYDEHAAGPLACFTYLQQLGVQAIAVAITHTKSSESKKWPPCWQSSGFSKLWRFWSTCCAKSLTAATDEMSVLNPPGRRQKFATTTIINDAATLEAVHRAYRDAIPRIRAQNVKDMSWTLVLQPLLPDWARKGDPNVLGLESRTNEPLVNVSFTVNWGLPKDDATIQQITRAAIEQIDAYATQHGTGHRYRYLNYCDSWQKPFDGYGEDNLRFMRDVSQKYDPDGLFQRGCVGGFKLGD